MNSVWALVVALLLVAGDSAAGALPGEKIELWPAGLPGEAPLPRENTIFERGDPAVLRDRIAYEVGDPQLIGFEAAQPTGQSLLIIPGGGYRRVVLDKEGFEIAEWFSAHGISCFVLVYRLPGEGWANREEVPLQDAQRALRLIRNRAPDFGLDPNAIGVIGFSAGGHVAASLATRFDEQVYTPSDDIDAQSARPDFAVLAYPVISMDPGIAHAGSLQRLLGDSPGDAARRKYSVELNVGENAPPTFLLHSADDASVDVENSLRLHGALRSSGVASDLHVFTEGGHGFGLREARDKPVSAWPRLVKRWMQASPYPDTAVAAPWNPNVDAATYRNPIIFADYSDPDVVRVGDDFHMTASSFNVVPALPILHSKDMVNWRLINHAIDRFDDRDFDAPQHGNGVWAPAIRFHDGYFYIFYGDPDRGIYSVRTRDPRGRWDKPVLVRAGKGLIDPAPFWDEDGRAWLVHAFAKSRAGFNSVLHIAEMSPDGTSLLGDSRLVFDGHENHPTIEGPKLYKRGGFYYIFAPAGGVAQGWQTVLRSRNIYGPYEDRIVLAQGDTDVNGPHQGAWIELGNGQHWFIHFQEYLDYGRIVHLQPMRWIDGWPVMGVESDGDGIGEPVLQHERPAVGRDFPVMLPQTSDDFEAARLGLQWQWHANDHPGWYSLTDAPGKLRLFAQPMASDWPNFWHVPNLLLQKFPAPRFIATTDVMLRANAAGTAAGLVVMGTDYAWLGVRRSPDGAEIMLSRATNTRDGSAETEMAAIAIDERQTVFLRAEVAIGAEVTFSYSVDGRDFQQIGKAFQARQGRWIGAKIGLFALRPDTSAPGSFADFGAFVVE